MTSTREIVSMVVEYERRKNDITKKELAKALGVSHKYLYAKMKEGRWSLDELDKMSQLFCTSPADIVSGRSLEEMEDLEDIMEEVVTEKFGPAGYKIIQSFRGGEFQVQ